MTTLSDQSASYPDTLLTSIAHDAEANRNRVAALMDELNQALANWSKAVQERDLAQSQFEGEQRENRTLRNRVASLEIQLQRLA